jgi:hypothetical protein
LSIQKWVLSAIDTSCVLLNVHVCEWVNVRL